ncbi:uncharacterized protein LOC144451917 [Glandiceps talaboti]
METIGLLVLVLFLSTSTQTFALECLSCKATSFDELDSCYNPASEVSSSTIGVILATCGTDEVCRTKTYVDGEVLSLERGCFNKENFCKGKDDVQGECSWTDNYGQNCHSCCNSQKCNRDVPGGADVSVANSALVVMLTSVLVLLFEM